MVENMPKNIATYNKQYKTFIEKTSKQVPFERDQTPKESYVQGRGRSLPRDGPSKVARRSVVLLGLEKGELNGSIWQVETCWNCQMNPNDMIHFSEILRNMVDLCIIYVDVPYIYRIV